MAKLVVLLLLLAYTDLSEQGPCTGDDASYRYQSKLTCSETLEDLGESTFCHNPNLFKDKCCTTWAATCYAAAGKWECGRFEDKYDKVIRTSEVCNGEKDCDNGEDETNCTGDLTGDYVVELLVVVDPKAQAPYLLENDSNKPDADKSILADIDYFLTEVNKLYHNFYEFKMSVSKLKVILLETDFLEDIVVDGKFTDKDETLKRFEAYLADTSAKETFNYDHALFFSGYDFMSGTPTDSAVAGYAPMSSACLVKQAVSIVEYDGTYGLVCTVAHEIGHNLGSSHDPSKTPYIMSPTTNQNERWTFSPLSTTLIEAYIHRLDKVDNNCLLKTASPSGAYNILDAPVTPALTDPNVVCERSVGKGAFYEPRTASWTNTGNPGLPSGDLLCDKIACKLEGEAGLPFAESSDGWACGIQKTCLQGKCVASTSDVAASVIDETCVFGDISLTNGLTCEEHLNKLGNADFCHDIKMERGCCGTYARTCTEGKCTFGDKINIVGTGGRDCPTSLDYYRKSGFCSEGNADIFKPQCCESYPKICGDQGRKRTLIDLLVDRLETLVAREGGQGHKLEPVEPMKPSDAPVARGLDDTHDQEPVFPDPVIKHEKRDDIAPEPIRAEKRYLEPEAEPKKRSDVIASKHLRSETRTLVDILMEKLEEMENHK